MVRTEARPTAARGVLTEEPMEILGETGFRGPVLIAWDAARTAARHPERGHDVVLHEFAHQLDLRDGMVDGTPPMDDPEERQRWIDVCTPALERVRPDDYHHHHGVLDPYAGTNPGEFFAVSTEVFFTRPTGLRHAQPALYEVLADFYRQDPAGTRVRCTASDRVIHEWLLATSRSGERRVLEDAGPVLDQLDAPSRCGGR